MGRLYGCYRIHVLGGYTQPSKQKGKEVTFWYITYANEDDGYIDDPLGNVETEFFTDKGKADAFYDEIVGTYRVLWFCKEELK